MSNSSVDQKKRTTIISQRKMLMRMSRPSIGNSTQFFPAAQSDEQSDEQVFTRTIWNSISTSVKEIDQSSEKATAFLESSEEQESDHPFIHFSNDQQINSTAPRFNSQDLNRKRFLKRTPGSSIGLQRHHPSQQLASKQSQLDSTHEQIRVKSENSPVVFSNALLNKSLSFFPFQSQLSQAQKKPSYLDFTCQTEDETTEATTATSSSELSKEKAPSTAKIKLYFDRTMQSSVKILENYSSMGTSTSKNRLTPSKNRSVQSSFFFKLPNKEQNKYGDKPGGDFQDRNQRFLMRQQSLLNYLRSSSQQERCFDVDMSRRMNMQSGAQQTPIELNGNSTDDYLLKTQSTTNSKILEVFPSSKISQSQQRRQVLHLKPIPLIQPSLIDFQNEQEIAHSNCDRLAQKRIANNQMSSIKQNQSEVVRNISQPPSQNVSPTKLEKRQLMTRLIRCRHPKRTNDALAQTISKITKAFDDSNFDNQFNTYMPSPKQSPPLNPSEKLVVNSRKN